MLCNGQCSDVRMHTQLFCRQAPLAAGMCCHGQLLTASRHLVRVTRRWMPQDLATTSFVHRQNSCSNAPPHAASYVPCAIV